MINKNGLKILNIYILASFVASCGITHLPGDVQNSIGQTESGIASATKKLSQAKSIQKNNFVDHTSTGYFGNQVIMQTNTDFLPPVFNNQIQIDKQFYGMKSIWDC